MYLVSHQRLPALHRIHLLTHRLRHAVAQAVVVAEVAVDQAHAQEEEDKLSIL